ncbi:GIY-YIG nuclease family protein [Candidatus Dependentiae bacterium]|nr:GIY-YIG nuclease family protein [Candidatus Dependentiae bacterium]
MQQTINQQLLLLPRSPGVYLMKNQKNQVIYIGKAKELKKRVSSYFRQDHKDWKTDLLVGEVLFIEHVVTATESEALLLEAQLINTHKPQFNILLKHGNPFLYLMITNDAIPALKLTRNKKQRGTYFGPFFNKGEARQAHRMLLDLFALRICNKKIANGCLQYHLGICSGSCKPTFNEQEHRFKIALIISILEGKSTAEIETSIAQMIAQHNNALEFEASQRWHQQLQSLSAIIELIKLNCSPKKYAPELAVAYQENIVTPIANDTVRQELQELLQLPIAPITIDCFDISHFQSSHIVGSCVRFTGGLPDKSNFRRFAIKTVSKQNDYAALQEIVKRRYKLPDDLPDLIVIDGGIGQLHAVQHLVRTTPIVALAKRHEEVYSSTLLSPVRLDLHTAAGKLLIALRDYTHHFAVSYHTKRRTMKFLE